MNVKNRVTSLMSIYAHANSRRPSNEILAYMANDNASDDSKVSSVAPLWYAYKRKSIEEKQQD